MRARWLRWVEEIYGRDTSSIETCRWWSLVCVLGRFRTSTECCVGSSGVKIQKPVYYVSKVLHGAELNYLVIEKFVLAMITASRKLRPYFQFHKIEVLTDQPLLNVIHSPKASGRLIKWAIELGEFDIRYKPWTAIKAQALANFLVECTISN